MFISFKFDESAIHMERNIININSSRRINNIAQKNFDGLNRNKKTSNQYNIEQENFDDDYFSSSKLLEETIPFENIVSFIIEYGEKVNEKESEQYHSFMLSYHICIEFYGIKYYIPHYRYTTKEEKVYNYLDANYKTV